MVVRTIAATLLLSPGLAAAQTKPAAAPAAAAAPAMTPAPMPDPLMSPDLLRRGPRSLLALSAGHRLLLASCACGVLWLVVLWAVALP